MNLSKIDLFRSLHCTDKPFLLVNVWDAASAAIVQSNGAKAIATSSAALAWSLGYGDGNLLPKIELLQAVKRITRISQVPISIDIENGYSNKPSEVADLVASLVELGVTGINIEDGIDSSDILNAKICAIREKVGSKIFINARTDVYLRALVPQADALQATRDRLLSYCAAGADCVFIPGLSDVIETAALVKDMPVPLNLMVSGERDQMKTLAKAGVRRFSLGPMPFIAAYSSLRTHSFLGQDEQTTQSTVQSINYDSMNHLFTL